MSTNFAIFLVFFGVAALDAVRGGDWLRIVFWAVIALFFLWADRRAASEARAARQAGPHAG